jgi:hypothetical protein
MNLHTWALIVGYIPDSIIEAFYFINNRVSVVTCKLHTIPDFPYVSTDNTIFQIFNWTLWYIKNKTFILSQVLSILVKLNKFYINIPSGSYNYCLRITVKNCLRLALLDLQHWKDFRQFCICWTVCKFSIGLAAVHGLVAFLALAALPGRHNLDLLRYLDLLQYWICFRI